MVYDKVLSGKFVELHSVTPEDAEFILKLRQNDEIARYLHRIDNSVEQQIDWIKLHQKLDGDYFFLIWSKNTRERLGTISLYDKKDDHCEIGRAVSIGNPIENVEAFLLVFDFAFNDLGYKYLVGTIVPENNSVKSLTARFGVIHEQQIHNINGMQLQFGKVTKEDYYLKRPGIINLLKKAGKVMPQ